MPTFIDLGVPAPLVSVLNSRGITDPFPIQSAAIPDAIAGRNVLGRGRTGSGKTVAFALPMLARLGKDAAKLRQPHAPRGLILAPTRELATQIADTITPYADVMGLRVSTVFGGVSQWGQVKALRAGVDVLVACPGRLEDLKEQGEIYLDNIEMTVIDEADLMADMGFLPGVTRVLEATPADSQRMLFSATLDGDIDTLVKRFLPEAILHEGDLEHVEEGVMEHRVFLVNTHDDKMALVEQLAMGSGKRILFSRTKLGAERLANQLTASGIPALDLHGNLPQRTRDRNLRAFSVPADKGGIRVLVATDVAARGVHVDDVELVVHVDPPAEHKAFLHRSGRTARAGASGTVVTISLPAQRRDLMSVLRRAKIDAPLERTSAGAPEIEELVGETAERLSRDEAEAIKASAGRKDRPQRGGHGQGPRRGQQGRGGQFGGARGPRREFGNREFGNRDDRPRRDFEDRPRREFTPRDDQPRREFGNRDFNNRDDRPRRDFGNREFGAREGQPRREYGNRDFNNRDDRPRRDFDNRDNRDSRPRREYEDRPRRDFGNRDDRSRGSYGERPARFDAAPRRHPAGNSDASHSGSRHPESRSDAGGYGAGARRPAVAGAGAKGKKFAPGGKKKSSTGKAPFGAGASGKGQGRPDRKPRW